MKIPNPLIRIKKFGLSLRVGPSYPAAFEDEFLKSGRRKMLNEFRMRAKRYRRRKIIMVFMLISTILVIFLFSKTGIADLLGFWSLAFPVSFILIAVFIGVFGMRLKCPACRKKLEPAKGLYCPQCGSDQFQYGRHKRGPSLFSYVYCPSCSTNIDEGSGDDPRSYIIRGCTHCGVMLDEKGL